MSKKDDIIKDELTEEVKQIEAEAEATAAGEPAADTVEVVETSADAETEEVAEDKPTAKATKAGKYSAKAQREAEEKARAGAPTA